MRLRLSRRRAVRGSPSDEATAARHARLRPCARSTGVTKAAQKPMRLSRRSRRAFDETNEACVLRAMRLALRRRNGGPTRYAAFRTRDRPEVEPLSAKSITDHALRSPRFQRVSHRGALRRVDTIEERPERETFMHGMHLRRRKYRRCLIPSSGTIICHFRRRGFRFFVEPLSSPRSGPGLAGARRRSARAARCTFCPLAGRVPTGTSPFMPK